MIDSQTIGAWPIRVNRPYSHEFEFDAGVFSALETYSGNIVETTSGPVLVSNVSITFVSSTTILIELTDTETDALDVITFTLDRGLHRGRVLLDVMRTDTMPDEPMNILFNLEVIRSL